MSSTTPVAPSPPAKGQSKLYKLVVTPIVFVSFLFSLAWIEFRYSLGRHERAESSQMPAWLHHIIYRQVGRGDQSRSRRRSTSSSQGQGRPRSFIRNDSENESDEHHQLHYHAMQKKLLKMEATEAFRIRTTVLCVMGLVLACLVWAASVVVRWAVALLG